jgi:hypothetical protein
MNPKKRNESEIRNKNLGQKEYHKKKNRPLIEFSL